jgi:hypothetical protein
MRTLRPIAAALFAVTLAAVLVAGAGRRGVSSSYAAGRPRATTLRVGPSPVGRVIPSGFLGLATVYPGVAAYAGHNPDAIDPVFEQLIRNLSPGQRPLVRIGGDSTDWTWWPVTGMVKPPGIRFTLSKDWLRVTRALAQALGARLLLGINLEANSGALAATEERKLVQGIGRKRVAAFELGNEPEFYNSFPWYTTPAGIHVPGRPAGWDPVDYLRDYSRIARSMPKAAPLAGPSIGSAKWSRFLGRFLTSEPRVGLVTLHRYGLKHCGVKRNVSIAELLSGPPQRGLAEMIAPYARLTHARHIPLRIEEMNAISCGGERGVSDTFASALWALDTLFEFARVGIDGVNINTKPGSLNELFILTDVDGTWHASVRPEYYGLMMFAQAAPRGSRLLHISGSVPSRLHAWATRSPHGQVHIVLINDSLHQSRLVKIRAGGAHGAAMLERMTAPRSGAKSGIKLGGQQFAATTGLLAGQADSARIVPVGGYYVIRMPTASAALLTL